jgi:hypothetical protein
VIHPSPGCVAQSMKRLLIGVLGLALLGALAAAAVAFEPSRDAVVAATAIEYGLMAG